MLWTFSPRARLLLPGELMDELSEDAVKTLLVHELAHYRRRDHWVRGLELIAASLFWWHPVVWWAIREIREVEEECCDAWVVDQLPTLRGDVRPHIGPDRQISIRATESHAGRGRSFGAGIVSVGRTTSSFHHVNISSKRSHYVTEHAVWIDFVRTCRTANVARDRR